MWLNSPSLTLPGDEAELRDLAMRELKAMGGKDFQAPNLEEAGDRTNTVRVTVGRSGAVKDVHVRGDWRTEIGGHRFGPALLEAYENANLAMMNSVALASLAEQEREAVAHTSAGLPDEYLSYIPSYIPQTDIWQIWQMLADVEDLMCRTEKLGRHAPDEIRTVHGPYGYLTAKCSGSAITSITADVMRVEQAEAERLGREALELFRELETLRTF
jgi:hypothetical protein